MPVDDDEEEEEDELLLLLPHSRQVLPVLLLTVFA